jgi:FlaG/FlaF family flagellin (archaellin)
MKGVSAVIAIILILMIVVALAALAYTWFTGIFASLTTTAGAGVTQTTTAMSTQFAIEAAKCVDNDATNCGGQDCVHVTIRNVGTSSINVANIETYVDDAPVTEGSKTGSIDTYETSKFYAGTAAGEVTCGTAKNIKVTTETGLSQTVAIT